MILTVWVFTFPVVTESHLGLTQANCVFALTDAIELFELRLVYTLALRSAQHIKGLSPNNDAPLQSWTYLVWEVDFNGFNANVLWTRGHDGESELDKESFEAC